MKIDVFTHAVPASLMKALAGVASDLTAHTEQVPTLALTAARILDDPRHSIEFARIANDSMAELAASHPNRFAAGTASVPTTNLDAAVEELDRALGKLNLRGVQLFTPIRGRPLDLAGWLPLFETAARFDLPVWIHPVMPIDRSDYTKYFVDHVFGWPYESTKAMTGLALDGLFERLPRAKVIIHHCGAMAPFFEARIAEAYYGSAVVHSMRHEGLKRPLVDYMKRFYGDTALSGGTSGLMCGYAFFGPEHLLFGTDTPYDAELGDRSTRQTMASVDSMTIPTEERDLIYYGNARRLLNL